MPIERSGPITRGTQANLLEGVHSSAMPRPALDAVMQQVTRFAEQLVETYSTEIAVGEVGEGGTGQATEEPIIGDSPPSTLLYGRVQSGKTVAMILTSALCLDNGFRVVVVLTTDNVALVRQTAGRFKDLDGPRVFAAVKEGSSYEWEGQEDELRESIINEGMVLVCAKNAINLPEVIRFLQRLDASTYPVLVLDDEADAATPDTTLAARSSSRSNAPAHPSRMHSLVIANERPNEEGFSLGEELPHSLYVQVTATPYVLFLQRQAAQIRPTRTFLLDAGEGYCGGEVFFGGFDPGLPADRQPPPIVLVGDNESALMRRQAPLGLAKSLNFFILSACARAAQLGNWPNGGFKHLAHTSHKTDEHEVVSGYIEAHLNLVRRHLRAGDNATEAFFEEAYAELTRSIAAPALADLIVSAQSAIRHAEVIRINFKTDAPDYGPRLNFIVGGNILGRGLTLDDLLVTYYVREAKTSQMDTVWQHARMYGYRRSYLDYIRIYLPRRLALRFKQIHESEEALRAMVAENADPVLIRLPSSSRATRPNALEPGAISALGAGRAQINPQLTTEEPNAAAEVLRILRDNDIPVSERDRNNRARRIPLQNVLDLIGLIPVSEEDTGVWQPDTIIALMQNFAQQLENGCVVYVRGLRDGDDDRTTGRLSGPEIRIIRSVSPDAPALALMHLGGAEAPNGWYPTVVMPADNPGYVFSRS